MNVRRVFDRPTRPRTRPTRLIDNDATRLDVWDTWNSNAPGGVQTPILKRFRDPHSADVLYERTVQSPRYQGPNGMYSHLQTSYQCRVPITSFGGSVPNRVALLRRPSPPLEPDERFIPALGSSRLRQGWTLQLKKQQVKIATDQGEIPCDLITELKFGHVRSDQVTHGETWRDALVNVLGPLARRNTAYPAGTTSRVLTDRLSVPSLDNRWVDESDIMHRVTVSTDGSSYNVDDRLVLTELVKAHDPELDEPFVLSEKGKLFTVSVRPFIELSVVRGPDQPQSAWQGPGSRLGGGSVSRW